MVYIHPVVLSYRNKPKTKGKTMTTTIKIAETRNRWAIAITKTQNRTNSGAEIFSVVRVSPKNQYVTLTQHDNETEARKSANRYWSLDRTA